MSNKRDGKCFAWRLESAPDHQFGPETLSLPRVCNLSTCRPADPGRTLNPSTHAICGTCGVRFRLRFLLPTHLKQPPTLRTNSLRLMRPHYAAAGAVNFKLAMFPHRLVLSATPDCRPGSVRRKIDRSQWQANGRDRSDTCRRPCIGRRCDSSSSIPSAGFFSSSSLFLLLNSLDLVEDPGPNRPPEFPSECQ